MRDCAILRAGSISTAVRAGDVACMACRKETRLHILSVASLTIPEIKIIRFGRFRDHRGYFTEVYRKSDFREQERLGFLRDIDLLQGNESYSEPGTIRGLHFQWNPYMGKLVRTVAGHMIDLVLDIRRGAPTFGRIIAHDMAARADLDYGEWIWIPPGFAHGNFFLEGTCIEYHCSGEYNPACESGISPLAHDLDWSLCDPGLRARFDGVRAGGPLLSVKDASGFTLASWLQQPASERFVFGNPL